MIRRVASLCLLLGLGACAGPPQGEPLAREYALIEALYRGEQKFRTDFAPADAPFGAEQLAGNFLKIAFSTEPQRRGDREILGAEEIALSRWDEDVAYAVLGGEADDRAHLRELARRLGALTGRDIREVADPDDAALKVAVFAGPERRHLIRELGPPEDPVLAFFTAWYEESAYPCVGSISSSRATGAIELGFILIKDELGGDFRRACLTEEFVQALGLVNDSPDVRPSIFNDDQEFIELTQHDEYLLQILYDERLSTGMSRAEAEPLVRRIARELTGTRRGPESLQETDS